MKHEFLSPSKGLKLLEPGPKERGVQRLAKKIALSGGQVSNTEFVAKWEPWCDEPVKVVKSTRGNEYTRSLLCEMFVPCRKCEKCLKFRRLQIRERILHECVKAKRTWMVTLTFSSVHLAGIYAEARTQKWPVERAAYKHVQQYFKRLRSAYPRSQFRYFAVYEEGDQNGRAHYHLAIHEIGDRPLLSKWLDGNWRSFTHRKLVRSKQGAASYITKNYLTKNETCKFRASLSYGKSKEPT